MTDSISIRTVRTIFLTFLAIMLGLLLTPSAKGQGYPGYFSFCTNGGNPAKVSGISSTNQLLSVYPACTVTVYAAGTTNLATIYSSTSGATLSNPFTANTNGSFLFFASTGAYDIRMSGSTLPAPFTISAVNLGGSGGGGSFPQGIPYTSGSLTTSATGANIGTAFTGCNGSTPVLTYTGACIAAGGGGGGASFPAGIPLFTTAGTTPSTTPALPITAPFQTTANQTTTIFSTTFNEGSTGTNLVGTAPATGPSGHLWVDHDSGANPWVFTSGGGVNAATASSGPFNGPTFDLGVSDYSLHVNVANNGGGYMMIMLRYIDTNNMVFVNLHAGQLLPYYVVGGTVTPLGTAIAANFTDMTFTLSGATLTMSSAGGSPASFTIPNSPVGLITSTLWGFGLETGANAAVTSASATVTGISTGPCRGVLQSDGACGPIAANQGVATDNNGHAAPLPEVGYSTDSQGNTTIACQEDRNAGIFDPRCPRTDPVTHQTYTLATNSAEALQLTSTDESCWASQHGALGTIKIPPGTWPVGTASALTLVFGPANIDGPYATLAATYSANRVVSTFSSLSGTCLDGHTPFTNSVDGGSVKLRVTGCTYASCINPSTANPAVAGTPVISSGAITSIPLVQGGIYNSSYPPLVNITGDGTGATAVAVNGINPGNGFSGGLASIVVTNGGSGYTHATVTITPDPNEALGEEAFSFGYQHSQDVGPLYVYGSTGPCVVYSGIDSKLKGGTFTQACNSFLFFSPGAYNSTLYPGPFGDIEAEELDGQFGNFETYGYLQNPTANVYYHHAAIIHGGGNTTISGVFAQLNPDITILRPYGGCCARISDFRVDGGGGEDVVSDDSQYIISNFNLLGYCGASNVLSITGGQCNGITQGGGGDVSSNGSMSRTFFGGGGPSQATGDISGGRWSNLTGVTAVVPPDYGDTNGFGYQASFQLLDTGLPNGGVPLSGSNPDAINADSSKLLLTNSSATVVTNIQHLYLGKTYEITLDGNTSLSGGVWDTCNGHNSLAGPAHSLFTVYNSYSIYHHYKEVCPTTFTDWLQTDFNGQTAPTITNLATNDTFGLVGSRNLPNLVHGNIVTGGQSCPTTYTYSFTYQVTTSGGKQTDTPIVTNCAPTATAGPSNNVQYHVTIPNDWLEYKLIFQATTDPSYTSKIGTFVDVTATNGIPQPTTGDLKTFILTSITPITSYTIAAQDMGMNFTGGFRADPWTNAPTSITNLCMVGQQRVDPTTGLYYFCDSENHWTVYALPKVSLPYAASDYDGEAQLSGGTYTLTFTNTVATKSCIAGSHDSTNAIKTSAASTTSAVFTGNATDHFHYHCWAQ